MRTSTGLPAVRFTVAFSSSVPWLYLCLLQAHNDERDQLTHRKSHPVSASSNCRLSSCHRSKVWHGLNTRDEYVISPLSFKMVCAPATVSPSSNGIVRSTVREPVNFIDHSSLRSLGRKSLSRMRVSLSTNSATLSVALPCLSWL